MARSRPVPRRTRARDRRRRLTTRTPITSARSPAAFGKRSTAARTGIRFSTASTAPPRSARSRSRRAIRTSSTPAAARPRRAATSPTATASINRSMAARAGSNIGLKDSRQIGAIIVNPNDPNIVFVAALGHAFGPNDERGIFRTTDGGKTWQKVLGKDKDTGAIDVVFDPHNPNTLFAALWQMRRQPWFFSSGGAGQRALSLDRRRQHLAAAPGQRPARWHSRPHRRHRFRRGLQSRLRDHRGEGRRHLPLRRWRR